MSDHLIRRCDTAGCASEIHSPDDRPMLLATLNATATAAGWRTDETGAEPVDRCPDCARARFDS